MSTSTIKWNKTNRIRIDHVNIPADGGINIDLSSYVPSGRYIHTVDNVYLGSRPLPYIEYVTGDMPIRMTWAANVNSNDKTLTIYNRAGAWNDYTLYADITFS